jgi:EpsI family protein
MEAMHRMTYRQTATIVAIFFATMALLGTVNQSEQIKPNKNFDTFPMSIQGWQGETSRFDEEIYDVLGVDDSILAGYTSPGGDRVELYVGFYQSQKEGDLIHSPKNCMPGAGWNITRTSIEPVDVVENGKPTSINVIQLILEKGEQKQMVFYWFQSRGRVIASEYMQKIWLVIDSITKHRTDGSFVRLISPVTTDEAKALDTLKAFTRDIFPYLREYIPS